MQELSTHWDEIYSNKSIQELGWYEKDGSTTIKFLQDHLIQGERVFLTGAGRSLLVDDLLLKDCKLVLNDISKIALEKLKEQQPRLQFPPHEFIIQDLSSEESKAFPEVDIWIDRAVLHFLVEDEQVENYFKRLKSTVQPGGKVMLAEFTTGSALKCASLPIRHYSTEDYQHHLGVEFRLLKEMPYTFTNPRGEPRLYQYALFQRI